jgi:hypothetical protein
VFAAIKGSGLDGHSWCDNPSLAALEQFHVELPKAVALDAFQVDIRRGAQ